ncbi:undecaprenyldiphospho-muramoylpentapeptide beta-N-acetylglucosaminyltransferase [Fluviicola sp.]|jgi:UDP-N-acetylglucosamine--N-acetylmuramyl-(pentapeptide) pyrophosphoryl-undecaprenol N-acetylglucosamine transferase|uniref:undecaprenyldiphospho-muramoylpentapeptide beta-N-acetylglucosaminyltransferase n=1 Tax=Fluviicola sp. TaxID=1917219 RepID=UPI00281A5A2B|nr:undecaprenyldiphospho-muramoylpentapeptide beta-N-acetylglucosaminyltransferase [Fluviicola sp.]MDR0801645.1 undecaprenyldiphospho-muramoylpentapeptide beta-N-acetylglucosaminyltransferase [Fluviicola sp.]
MKELKKIVISGGGTGGHIFPALAIAGEIKKRYPQAEILFVGAEGKMEMEKVPAAGYRIVGLPIVGLQRKLTLKNLALPFKLLKSLSLAKTILKDFGPEVVIGVGGYASGPTLKMAQRLGIPTLIQEQNSYPGKTNRLLSKKVKAVCTAYEGLESVFPPATIRLTGNPVREELKQTTIHKEEAFRAFPVLDPSKQTIFVMGGSLGARTMNEGVLYGLNQLEASGVQVLWQCGKYYFESMKSELASSEVKNVHVTDFIARMDAAYALADVIVSRAGALSISELCIVGKPTILVPSPNVSEDHQTKNAMALVKNNAAILIKDAVAKEQLISEAVALLKDENHMNELRVAIKQMAKPNATRDIVDVIETLMTN